MPENELGASQTYHLGVFGSEINNGERREVKVRIRDFIPSGDIIEDFKKFYELKGLNFDLEFSDWPYYDPTAVNPRDPASLYNYFKKKRDEGVIPPDADEFVKEHVKTIDRILEAYEAKRGK